MASRGVRKASRKGSVMKKNSSPRLEDSHLTEELISDYIQELLELSHNIEDIRKSLKSNGCSDEIIRKAEKLANAGSKKDDNKVEEIQEKRETKFERPKNIFSWLTSKEDYEDKLDNFVEESLENKQNENKQNKKISAEQIIDEAEDIEEAKSKSWFSWILPKKREAKKEKSKENKKNQEETEDNILESIERKVEEKREKEQEESEKEVQERRDREWFGEDSPHLPPPPIMKNHHKDKNKHHAPLAVLAIVGITFVALLFLVFGVNEDCGDDASCFVGYATGCDSSSFIKDFDGTKVEFKIEGCTLTKEVIDFAPNEPYEVVQTFKGKTMSCPTKKGNFELRHIEDLSYTEGCSGSLKTLIDQFSS